MPAYQPQANPMSYPTHQPSGQYDPKQPYVTQNYASATAQQVRRICVRHNID